MRVWKAKYGKGFKVSLTTKLILSFLFVIVMSSAIFTSVGIWLIRSHVEDDAERRTRDDLEMALEIYLEKLEGISTTVQSAAVGHVTREAIAMGDVEDISNELLALRIRGALDLLAVTDEFGRVIHYVGNPARIGAYLGDDGLVRSVIDREIAAAATTLVSIDDTSYEPQVLAANSFYTSYISFEPGERNAASVERLLLGAAAPVFGQRGELVGVIYGGVFLNDKLDFVCEIKRGVYKSNQYKEQDIGLVTLYQDGDEILSCPPISDPELALNSPLSEEMYAQIIDDGSSWFGRVNFDDRWYLSVFEPIKDNDSAVVGLLQVARLEQEYLDINKQMVIAFVTITVIGSLLAIAFAYFISRRISGPIRQLVLASRNVAEGNLDARVDISSMSNDELGEMGVAFNAMTLALEERDAKLRELTQSRIHRSERLALIGKLSADIAHELNNPLQGIVTYSNLILEQMPADNPTVRYVDVIVTQANRCREIIRGLLDFARQRETDRSRQDINLVIQDALTFLENQALFQNIHVELELDPELPLIVIDPTQMERVFVNLMINAAEAMNGHGNLTLATEFDPENDETVIYVTDTGHGITEEDMRKIFDPFFTTKEVGQGTGLGLSLSYGIIREHDGSIAVESEVGVGTTFTVRIPTAAGERVITVDG